LAMATTFGVGAVPDYQRARAKASIAIK